MTREACSCDRLWWERHREGCPRHNDHSAADAVKEALFRRHPFDSGEWVSWPEVFRIDVFAMRFWSSGIGLRRVGYEVKVSRADFLAEIRKPEKRALALELCHQFYFACPRGLVQPHEIPSECGLVEVSASGKARTVVKAPLREPRWFTEGEVMSLLRMDLFRTNSDRMKTRLQTAEQRAVDLQESMAGANRQLNAAWDRLEELAGSDVSLGSTWSGLWRYDRQRWGWPGPAKDDPVTVEVTELGSSGVRFRVVGADGRGYEDRCSVGEFLMGFARA